MNKIIKRLIVIIMISLITLPTNAAVSVSDGSAFISKAEHDTDYNSLSNRLSNLENSLDAKIDSLVSSYLSRNGIWNGEKQLTNYTFYPGVTTTTVDLTSFVDEAKNFCQATKSGLLFIDYEQVNCSGTWGFVRSDTEDFALGRNTATSTKYVTYFYPFITYLAFATRSDPTASISMDDWLATLQYTMTTSAGWGIHSIIRHPGYGRGTISFFVNKGDYICYQPAWTSNVYINAYNSNNVRKGRNFYVDENTIADPDYQMTVNLTIY